MHGTNPVSHARTLADGFRVHSIFFTLQGEGPWAGWPAIFVRMAGCNLRCTFCDTEFDDGTVMDLSTLEAELRKVAHTFDCNRFVWTGGEPLLQPIHEVINRMQEHEHQIETAGTLLPFPRDDLGWIVLPTIVVSPKTPKLHDYFAEPGLIDWQDQDLLFFKYIIRDGYVSARDGLPTGATQRGGNLGIARPPDLLCRKNRVFVQPMDVGDEAENRRNLDAAVGSCMKFGYRLSIQMHKIAGLD